MSTFFLLHFFNIGGMHGLAECLLYYTCISSSVSLRLISLSVATIAGKLIVVFTAFNFLFQLFAYFLYLFWSIFLVEDCLGVLSIFITTLSNSYFFSDHMSVFNTNSDSPCTWNWFLFTDQEKHQCVSYIIQLLHLNNLLGHSLMEVIACFCSCLVWPTNIPREKFL